MNVVRPATTSIRTEDPRSEILKNRSSLPPGGASTRTTFAVLVSVSAMGLPLPAGETPASAVGKSREA